MGNKKLKHLMLPLAQPVMALAFALLVGMLAILVTGENPLIV